jgi:hypothetical protein
MQRLSDVEAQEVPHTLQHRGNHVAVACDYFADIRYGLAR